MSDETCIHHSSRMKSFKDTFKTHLYTDEVGQSKYRCFFVDDGDYCISLSITSEKLENKDDNSELFKISKITWQEEYLHGGLHNVCRSRNKDMAIYDFTKNKFVQDIYLYDKYDDGSDNWFSSRPIATLFVEIPEAEFAKRCIELIDSFGYHCSALSPSDEEWRDYSDYDPEHIKKIDKALYNGVTEKEEDSQDPLLKALLAIDDGKLDPSLSGNGNDD